MKNHSHFIAFKQNISGIHLPQKFTFPFYYEPHQLSKIAASELQDYLQTQTDWEHNFGLQEGQKGLVIGKMFGVLVVQNQAGEIGYLAAFSGKLADSNEHQHFVPPVFDMLKQDGFFKQEEKILNEYNRKIEALENETNFISCQNELASTLLNAEKDKTEKKELSKQNKIIRDEIRMKAENELDFESYKSTQKRLSKESQLESIQLKQMNHFWKEEIAKAQQKVDDFQSKINQLKEERKAKSAALQQKLFQQYSFLNQNGETKSLGAIFEDNPPASAGECAAPKLLQYAFTHQLKPIALAEFWWGQSPKSEIRKHGHFYPACTGKCKPILAHMLHGMALDDNPLLQNPAENKELTFLYDDEYLSVVHKPAEFLSVPGKSIQDSVYSRYKEKFPEATGPLIVHRLDMSTSGILVMAKSTEIYLNLQAQFMKRTVQKRYVALLSGKIEQDSGEINLPLRVDLDNRPNQLVCYQHGKPAKTQWKVIERRANTTLVHFHPITGRTHQLRVHAAHPEGLNTPIVGDDLYGTKADRLYLHAEAIRFWHPVLGKELEVVDRVAF
ncbi:RluA family pseudouridine synthase [Flavobacterium lacus]|uniref:tRNA pseudouridine32 synthase / 23S rRNA pseudouridine746 synthase n=1 Tax=Flavobacterium lacus TaxID=1353778 RepID=A0A328WR20_9FLAO|nr:RluA family pseudouridine synthase [Flavobacterium lacus]RAR48641.1 tRNA pseudouridine32 synthase / 23S rRNA pseudouridine746 synthase [Flavobacterium lacus]